jgi:hypothetical protein
MKILNDVIWSINLNILILIKSYVKSLHKYNILSKILTFL